MTVSQIPISRPNSTLLAQKRKIIHYQNKNPRHKINKLSFVVFCYFISNVHVLVCVFFFQKFHSSYLAKVILSAIILNLLETYQLLFLEIHTIYCSLKRHRLALTILVQVKVLGEINVYNPCRS